MSKENLSQTVCHVDLIYSSLDGKLKRSAAAQLTNSRAAVVAYQKLINARRARNAHVDRCPLCKQPDEPKVLSADEVRRFGDAINELFEEEAMRLARIQNALEHSLEEAA